MTRAENIAVLAAIVLHVGVLGVAQRVRGNNLLAEELAVEVEYIDVEVLAREKEEPFVPAGVPNIHAPQPTAVDPQRRSDGAPLIGAEPGATGTPETGVVTAPGEPGQPGPGEWSAPPGESWLPPGFGANGPIYNNPDFLAMPERGPSAPTQAPKAREVDRDIANKVVKETLRREDKKLGLDLPAAGTVASMFRTATLASDTPATSRASFSVALGPGGKVRSVKLISASAGQASSWEAIAANVKAALSAQKLALNGDYAKGAVIVVNVQSKMQMPSGAKVDAGLEFSLTQTFDVADIGSKPVRVVSAQANATPVE